MSEEPEVRDGVLQRVYRFGGDGELRPLARPKISPLLALLAAFQLTPRPWHMSKKMPSAPMVSHKNGHLKTSRLGIAVKSKSPPRRNPRRRVLPCRPHIPELTGFKGSLVLLAVITLLGLLLAAAVFATFLGKARGDSGLVSRSRNVRAGRHRRAHTLRRSLRTPQTPITACGDGPLPFRIPSDGFCHPTQAGSAIEDSPSKDSYVLRQRCRRPEVNMLFRSTEVELPPADKYLAFPLEAQKAILLGFRSEQLQRHELLRRQQDNDHHLTIRAQHFALIKNALGVVGAISIVFTLVNGGIALLNNGATAYGVSLIFTAIAGVIGTTIYGHRAIKSSSNDSEAEP